MKFDINKVAQLARLNLTADEKTALSADLEKIIGCIEKLGELKTDDVPPTSHVLNIENVYREDVAYSQHSAKEVLAALPEQCKNGHFFKVPKIIETD